MIPATPEWAAAQGIAAEPAPARYLEEPRGLARAAGGLVVRPSTIEDVARIVTACARDGVGIIPYGGGTGLVGGQVSGDGPTPVILSLERMNRLRRVEPEGNTMIVEAGVTLAEVQAAAAEADRLFPLSLASEGTCRIGGNLATNAGGVQVLRYGNARDLCLGIEAVLPDGSIHHGLTGLRKDNTGYDLRHLLIGAEGTLGIITAAALRLFPRPAQEATAMAVVPSPAAAIALLARMQAATGGLMSAFELIDGTGPGFVAEHLPQVRQPFSPAPPWMVLAEAGGGPNSALDLVFEETLGAGIEGGLVQDVLIAQSRAQRDEFWTLRETIPEANRLVGAVASHDISLPIPGIPDFVERGADVIARISPELRINAFGHLGDGNLHYNVFPPRGETRATWRPRAAEVSGAVHDLVKDFGGSISAEHGIGRFKRDALLRYGDPAKLAAMRAIKQALDPKGIMNPGAVI